MTERIAVVLVEDHRLLREEITAMLNQQADLAVVATGPARDQVLSLVRDARPRVVLLDSALGEQDSLRLVAAIHKMSPEIRIIVMDLLPTPQDVVEFVEAGCSGFIMKDAPVADFLATIRAVARGGSVLPPSLTGTIFTHVANQAIRRGPGAVRGAVRMTKREREVVALIGEGLSNKEIAERLHIVLHTVKSHVHNVLDKLALHTRLQVAAYAHREGDAALTTARGSAAGL